MPQPLIELVTDIAGEINGSAFACHGTGWAAPDGTTHATLTFDRALRDFTDGLTLPEPLGIEIAGTAAYNPARLTYQLDTTARSALMAVAG